MEILVIGSPNGNTANLLAPNNCCKVRTERVGGRCLWGDKYLSLCGSGDTDNLFKIYSNALKVGKVYNE